MSSLAVPQTVDRWREACDDDLAAASRMERRFGIGLRSASRGPCHVSLLAPPAPPRAVPRSSQLGLSTPRSSQPRPSSQQPWSQQNSPAQVSPVQVSPAQGGDRLLEQLLADPDPLAARMTAFWVHHLGHVAGDAEHLRKHGTGRLAEVAPTVDPAAFVRCLHQYFAGTDPTRAVAERLIDMISAGDHEIRSLIEVIASQVTAVAKVRTRPRHDFEWILGAAYALQIDDFKAAELVPDHSWGRGRLPSPASIEIARRAAVLSWKLPDQLRAEVPPEPSAVLAQCGIFDPSWATWSQLTQAHRRFGGRDDHLELLFALALSCREFAWL